MVLAVFDDTTAFRIVVRSNGIPNTGVVSSVPELPSHLIYFSPGDSSILVKSPDLIAADN